VIREWLLGKLGDGYNGLDGTIGNPEPSFSFVEKKVQRLEGSWGYRIPLKIKSSPWGNSVCILDTHV